MIAQLPTGPFDLIMADPPWRFKNFSKKGEGKNAINHYSCMTVSEIAGMDVASLASKNCLLWLWATAPMFREALAVMDAWGFTYSTQGVWVKTAKKGGLAFGTGYALRSAHEPFIIAKRGKPKIQSRSVRSVVMEGRREHSRKPENAYAAAEALGGPDATRLDLFSRQIRDGWTAWGNEADKFNETLPLAEAA